MEIRFSCSYTCSVCNAGKPTFQHFAAWQSCTYVYKEGWALTLLMCLACAKGRTAGSGVQTHRCLCLCADVWNSSANIYRPGNPALREIIDQWSVRMLRHILWCHLNTGSYKFLSVWIKNVKIIMMQFNSTVFEQLLGVVTTNSSILLCVRDAGIETVFQRQNVEMKTGRTQIRNSRGVQHGRICWKGARHDLITDDCTGACLSFCTVSSKQPSGQPETCLQSRVGFSFCFVF